MSKMTKEELDELQALEEGIEKDAAAAEIAAQRQRLEALRMRKRLGAKHGVHGRDFVVLETSAGVNVAIRRPNDVELDAFEVAKEKEPRAALESFLSSIVLEPSKEDVQAMLASYPTMGAAFAPAINTLMGSVREEEAKK
ncbi:MAG: hypothetical protein KF764_08585 [Labilithrix sp.]|nr:hypothetical protein [Labilithrix sp.]